MNQMTESLRNVAHAVVVEDTLKVCSKILCRFKFLGQTVSINLKFNAICFVYA